MFTLERFELLIKVNVNLVQSVKGYQIVADPEDLAEFDTHSSRFFMMASI